MDPLFYVLPFLTAFFLAVVCIVLLQFVFWRHLVAANSHRQEERHTHQSGTLRFGGIALIVSFLITLLTNSHIVLTTSWRGVIIASVFILVVGLWDDIREVSWKIQLLAQVVAGGVAFAFGIRMLSLTNPFGGAFFFDSGWLLIVSFVATITWILVVMNAINWADGTDGLCGGIAFIGFMTIFFLSVRPEINQPPVAILSLALAGSSLGFLVFNFYPARIFAGTSGSWFLGFMLATLALFSGTKIATAGLVLALPLLDALRVVFDRFYAKVSVFEPDTRHMHHRLRQLGWSSRAIALFFYAVTIIIAAVALYANTVEKIVTMCSVFIFAVLFFLWIKKQTV